MYNHWQEDLGASINAINAIKESVLPKFIKGKIVVCEGDKSEVAQTLDQYAGIDLLALFKGDVRGVASRVQWGHNFETFTIRAHRRSGAATEYAKRIRQIKTGAFYPFITMQAYFDNRKDNNLLGLAVCRTIDLYSFLIDHEGDVMQRKSDNLFFVVPWRDMAEKYPIRIYKQGH